MTVDTGSCVGHDDAVADLDDLLTTADASTVVARLRAGEVSSVEVLDAQLDRLDRFGGAVNAVIALDADRARAAATAADDARTAGQELGPLAGLPITLKDVFETEGLVTCAGSPALAEHVPADDADASAALKNDGAIVYGKTNVPLLAGDHQTINDVHGLTRNPWDPERTSGGSSGGAAVALACGFTTIEVGSDIGGSIREPSHFNGVYGLKPTQGLLSLRGHIPPMPGSLAPGDLGVVGPMGRSIADLGLVLDSLLGIGAFGGVPGASLPSVEGPIDLGGLRVALWDDQPDLAPVAGGVAEVARSVAAAVDSAGGSVSDARPSIEAASLHETYLALLTAAIGAGFPPKLFDRMVAQVDAGDAPSHVRTSVARFKDWARADEARHQAIAAWHTLFETVDVVIAPVAPTVAFPHNTETSYWDRTTEVDGDTRAYTELLFWAGLPTMPGLPSLVIPAGEVGGLPCGVQLIGPKWSERRLLAIGAALDAAIGRGFVPPPLVTGS